MRDVVTWWWYEWLQGEALESENYFDPSLAPDLLELLPMLKSATDGFAALVHLFL